MRDLFCNGFLDYLRDAGIGATIFTEAANINAFTDTWKAPGVKFFPFYPHKYKASMSRAFWMRRRIARLQRRSLLGMWVKAEESLFYRPNRLYIEYFKKMRPRLFFATNVNIPNEEIFISSAHSLDMPTIGFVHSWDNVHKGLRSRPRSIAVWNRINQKEAIKLEGYAWKDISITGAPQFDPYFDKNNIWERAKFAKHFKLDPKRPIILFASLGNFVPELDETCWMDTLLKEIKEKAIKGDPQIICRLHPWSRLEYFRKYASNPDVRLSFVDKYIPGLTWYMDKEDVIEMANMLFHADAIITPGTTVTLEAAIFDKTPIVPVFHPYQPGRAKDYFDTWVFGKHFGRIRRKKLVPIIYESKDFAPAVNKVLNDKSWYKDERERLVNDYVHFKDGSSTKRLAELIIKRVG